MSLWMISAVLVELLPSDMMRRRGIVHGIGHDIAALVPPGFTRIEHTIAVIASDVNRLADRAPVEGVVRLTFDKGWPPRLVTL